MSLCRPFCAASRSSLSVSSSRSLLSPKLVRHRSTRKHPAARERLRQIQRDGRTEPKRDGRTGPKRDGDAVSKRYAPMNIAEDFHTQKALESQDNTLLRPPRPLTPESPAIDIVAFFEANVKKWAFHERVEQRLTRFAVPSRFVGQVLNAFCKDVIEGKVRYADEGSTHPVRTMSLREKQLVNERGQNALGYNLARFARASSEDVTDIYMDMIYTSVLYAWAASPLATHYTHKATAKRPLPAEVIEQMANVTSATSPPSPESPYYAFTRSIRRKFIMHVGPTNSGKTYAALRALAAARTGMYAGPLRLLAHEIWERLNLGRIVPLGADESLIDNDEVDDSTLDVGDTKALIKEGRGKYRWRKECNMITGEEVKIVSDGAPFVSCTVEMTNLSALYDVAVIDEIQLIADPQRGFAWTNAILTLGSNEIHLCGEATAIPIVSDLIASTGDSLEIREYKRLTPLEVDDSSLGGRFENVRAGDCIVTFSRNGIFAIKRKLEQLGHRVSCIYGKLPPEVRSEQAALFNSGQHDVLVGSDALGLGLNLKIRRMVFSQAYKFTDRKQVPLSITQVKQIAGRAGRYGLHKAVPKDGSDASTTEPQNMVSPPGLVTSLRAQDLPFLRRTLELDPPPLRAAFIHPSVAGLQSLSRHITTADVYTRGGRDERERSYLITLLDAHRYTAQCPPWLRYSGNDKTMAGQEAVLLWAEDLAQASAAAEKTEITGGSTPVDFQTQALFLNAPLPLRDDMGRPFCTSLYRRYVRDLVVPLQACLEEGLSNFHGGFAELLRASEAALAAPYNADETEAVSLPEDGEDDGLKSPLPAFPDVLRLMELLHSLLGLYMWLSLRRPTSFPDAAEAMEMLPRTRYVLETLLNRRSNMSKALRLAFAPAPQGTPELIEYNGQKATKEILRNQRDSLFKEVQRMGTRAA